MLDRLEALGLQPLRLKGRPLLPIVQGGMGVGISAHRLASAVARENAIGTIASVDLRHHHADLMAQCKDVRDRTVLDRLNLIALEREIRAAKQQSHGRGLIAVNVMKAVDQHAALVRQSCESGADAIVMGAGLPLDLPEMCADFPGVALIPILSDARGVAIVLRRWMRKGRLPDAIVIEQPAYAGGHLGAPRIDELRDPRFDFDRVVEGVLNVLRDLKIEPEDIPLIAAGGINTHEKLRGTLKLGYAAVQLGTAFAVCEEGDAHINFKKVLAGAKPQDIVEFTSVAGLPARAVKTVWLERYLRREPVLQAEAAAFEEANKGKPVDRVAKCSGALMCLTVCGLRDGIPRIGQFCIDTQLAAALRGELSRGLFFRGASSVPFGPAIRPARELIDYMLTGRMPAALAQSAAAP
ncbi:MAG TPA: nitronate monooxygenase family protein [Burkholderiaceae bacterium]|nr:nitronate monooxygenase family protein [Burkholderiaceae bacterium]